MLDREIYELEAKINKYRSRADQEEDLAQRLQFQGENKDEARLAYKQVDRLNKKIHELEREKELLQKKKEELLKLYAQ